VGEEPVFEHVERVTVGCSPEAAYALVADITAMGRWSPVCTGGDWDHPSVGPTRGAWFTGHNRVGDRTWSTRCRVEVAEPGVAFAFSMLGLVGKPNDKPVTRWGFAFTATPRGTEVAESWQVFPAYLELAHLGANLDKAKEMAFSGMPATLANLRRVAEVAS
jgi:hypothetical protein